MCFLFLDLIYIPKIQLTTEKKGQGMAKAKSKNPVGRPKFEVTPEVLARKKEHGAGINQRTMRWRLGISPQPSTSIRQNSEFSDTIKKGAGQLE
jgi:hypothetical protein